MTISPGGDGYEGWSDEFIPVQPAQDRFLAAAVCQKVIEDGPDIRGLDTGAANGPAFREIVMSRPVAEMSQVCGLGPDEVRRLADIYGSGGPVVDG